MAMTRRRSGGCSLTEAFGRNFRAFRESEGLSREDFATLLGRETPGIELIERGEEELTLEAVEVIAATLGIEPLLLLDGPTRPA